MNLRLSIPRSLLVLAAVPVVLPVGCSQTVTRFDVIDYTPSGEAAPYVQTFDECYYCTDAHDNIDIVARVTTTNEQGLSTTQIVHMRTFWITRPGRTNAEPSMINATVGYHVLSGPTGATFEGSGFVSFDVNRRGDRITGELERSSLAPQRRLGKADRVFDRAELSGTFVATRDKQRVFNTLRDMRRRFGPMPDYDASSRIPDVR